MLAGSVQGLVGSALQAKSLWGRCVKGGCDLQWKLQGLTWGLGGMSPSGTVGARMAGGRSVV